MVFSIILSGVFTVFTVLLVLYSINAIDNEAFSCAAVTAFIAIGIAVIAFVFGLDAKANKALINAHINNPTRYTYEQLASHNELVTKLSVWHGTIFSFYNDTNLQTIDIDNVSQKIIVGTKDK